MEIDEPARRTSVSGAYDVIIAGSGPAGVSAALAAAEHGARTLLLEANGCLGGVWTSGLLSIIVDAAGKSGILSRMVSILHERGHSNRVPVRNRYTYSPEAMKHLLERLCIDAGVTIRSHARLCAVVREHSRITHVVTEAPGGREAWTASVFVDATGDGDLGHFAGCEWELGDENGDVQPMSMLTLLEGVRLEQISELVRWGDDDFSSKQRLLDEMLRAGVQPSIGKPALYPIYEDLFMLMGDHQHGLRGFRGEELTRGALDARDEIHRVVDALRTLGGRWAGLRIAATPEHMGVREGRRLRGRYTVTVEDIAAGRRHEDGICHVLAPVDVHPVSRGADRRDSSWSSGVKNHGYDIPLRALQSADIDNLFFAGRCISGDFIAHSSYRVTGDAAVTGEAVGIAAACFADAGVDRHEHLEWDAVRRGIERFHQSIGSATL